MAGLAGLRSRAAASKVIFSGIQPTGVPHLGNYAGALRQWVSLQNEEPVTTSLIYSVVDLHAITTAQPRESLKQWRTEALASLLAIGLDPDRCTIFHQSSVPAHAELMWILSCTASVGYLSRMTQWKSKLNLAESSSIEEKKVGGQLKLGLFSYPVLQAADILVHRATHVPVGQDQQQHLEFARECVTNFNSAYGKHLVAPVTLCAPISRVMSLTDPTAKMSKSHKAERSRILLTDGPDQIRKKIASALTDSQAGIAYDPANRPGISNLLDILSIFDTRTRSSSELASDYSDLSARQLKDMVSDVVITGLAGFRQRYQELLGSRRDFLDKVEADGAAKARRSAAETMSKVREAIGLAGAS
ncbi:tryptophanyl-tRNA synthetase [Emericellopsis atlantica]|uniref:Tryptophan--tRNA ligase, mitochondrial n=1 Tax=Emericellopsis atlantica TaxID=2614577 RepID=A0A9P7ZIV4_9HYPO|nr:tryptophanyl-tRNA synthetase [Emericellopsis atlantica]KAG9252746.1 tryptophanyl-tRNA synthetase [Emericellopsis atlantica]